MHAGEDDILATDKLSRLLCGFGSVTLIECIARAAIRGQNNIAVAADMENTRTVLQGSIHQMLSKITFVFSVGYDD
jgi:hypothetical protein